MEAGELSREKVEEAYYENLEIVLEEAQKLVEKMEGKTVITSDHGNVYGKRIGLTKVYGHGYGWSDKELVSVGWIELEEGERKEVKKGQSSDVEGNEEEIKEKLSQLGYGT